MKYVFIFTSVILIILSVNFICSYFYINWLFELRGDTIKRVEDNFSKDDCANLNEGATQIQYSMMERYGNQTGRDNYKTVRSNNTVVRFEPRKGSQKVGHIRAGEKVEVLDQNGDWVKIKINNITGWVFKTLLS